MPYDMKHDSYIETLVIDGKMINVFDNDYGQCYWFQWLDGSELKEASCGTYNLDYKQEIKDYFRSDTERLLESVVNLRQTVRELQREVEELKKN